MRLHVVLRRFGWRSDAPSLPPFKAPDSPDVAIHDVRNCLLNYRTVPHAFSFVSLVSQPDEHNLLTEGRLAPFCKPPWFLVFACCYVIIQSMVVTGLFAVSIQLFVLSAQTG